MSFTQRIAFVLLSCFLGTVANADSLSGQLHQAARRLAAVMDERNQDRLMMGQFGPSEGGLDTYGPGLRVDLAAAFAELAKENEITTTLADQAVYVLSGTYQVVDDPEDALAPKKGLPQLLVLKIDLELMQSGEVIFPITLFVDRVRDIAKASGSTGVFPPEDSARDLHQLIRFTRETPTFHVDGTRIQSSPTSEVSVEILTKSVLAGDSVAAQARPPITQGTRPVVPIAVGEVYEVRVHNDSDREIAVGMTIDGIDQFTFSEDRNTATGRPKFSHWIIGPKKSFTIKGWHKTADNSREDNLLRFLVTKYGDGASQFAPQPDRKRVGTIQLSISNSHEFRHGARGDSETGFGPPVKQKQKPVRREIDPPHEFVTIGYQN